MSNTGDWGDKIIINLRSDGIRRHKKWCENYQDGSCKVLCSKCIGSAFCKYYKSKIKEDESTRFYPKPDIQIPPLPPPSNVPDTIPTYKEHYRPASYGDKLLAKIVLVRITPFIFRIGVVTEESFRTFSVIYDEKYINTINALHTEPTLFMFLPNMKYRRTYYEDSRHCFNRIADYQLNSCHYNGR